MAEFKLDYTGAEINERLGKIDDLDVIYGYMNGGTVVLDNIANGSYSLKFENWTAPLSDVDAINVTITDTNKEQCLGYIEQNCAPLGAKRIGVYSGSKKVGNIRLTNPYFRTESGEKLYSFGALSDVHYQYDTAAEDFQRALTFLNSYGAEFTCICGDLTELGTTEHLAAYKNCVDTYKGNMTVYATTGNHEGYNANIENVIETYTGTPLYYKIERGSDVFIFVGVKGDAEDNLFAAGELQWLYETLEEHRNQRCFVFQHVRPQDGCGNAFGIYGYDIWGGTEAIVFESLMRHYRNVILFHGHSHLKLGLQTLHRKANYDNDFGIHSVHIPSLSVPRGGNAAGASSSVMLYAESEGYVVDVYEDGIMLRGRDFVDGKYLPEGTYWLDTRIKCVPEKTYMDSTGTIVTGSNTGGNTGGDTGPTYTNLLSKSIGCDGLVFQDDDLVAKGYANEYYLSGTANKVYGNATYMSSDSSFFTTGFIPYTVEQANAGTPIYVKGCTIDTTNSHTRMAAYNTYSDYSTYHDPVKFSTGNITVETLGESYYKLTPTAEFVSSMTKTTVASDFKYIRMSLSGTGDNVIITVDEEIV